MNLNENVNISAETIIRKAKQYIAGGVVSLNRIVDPAIVFSTGKGSKIYDIDGNEYIDYRFCRPEHIRAIPPALQ